MNPVDPRPAIGRVHRPRAAEDDYRQTVRPGIVDRHRRVLQADDIVHRRGHRLTLGARVAVRQRDADFLMVAKNNLGRVIAAVIHQRIVQSAERRSRVDRDVLNLKSLQQIDDDVRSPLGSWFLQFLCFGHSHIPFFTKRAAICPANVIVQIHEHEPRTRLSIFSEYPFHA